MDTERDDNDQAEHEPSDAQEQDAEKRFMVYRYGLLAPEKNASIVSEQMRLAHAYRNRLCEIERGRRAALRDAEVRLGVREAQTTLQAASAATSAIVEKIKSLRASKRARSVPAEMTLALRDAKAAEGAARKAFSACRAALRESGALAEEAIRINACALELITSARKFCGVYWGTYQLVEFAMRAASKMPLYDGSEPSDPRFARWNDEGAVSVQLQGGLAVEDLFGGNTLLRVNPVDPAAWKSPIRSERRRLSRTTLHLRVGSEARDPVWASFPMIMHREIPPGSVIKRVTATLRHIGPRPEWSVEFTVELPPDARKTSCGEGIVAVDLGWRMKEGGMRVAMYLGDDMPEAEELLLPTRMLDALTKGSAIQATRSRAFDVAIAALVSLVRRDPGVPDWVRKDAATAGRWKSENRLARLVRRWWATSGVGNVTHAEVEAWTDPGVDAWTLRDLELWRYHDFHLWEYGRSQTTGALRNRREVYRAFAAKLASRYKTLVLEDFDLRDVAEKPSVESPGVNTRARSNRHLAAVSELRGALVNAFVSGGGETREGGAAYSTMKHNACGYVDEAWDASLAITHVCRRCGKEFDQDENACRNLIDWHLEKIASGGYPEAAKKPAKASAWKSKK